MNIELKGVDVIRKFVCVEDGTRYCMVEFLRIAYLIGWSWYDTATGKYYGDYFLRKGLELDKEITEPAISSIVNESIAILKKQALDTVKKISGREDIMWEKEEIVE